MTPVTLLNRLHHLRRPSWRALAALLAAVAVIAAGLVLRAGGTFTTTTAAAGHRPSDRVHLAGYDTPANPNGPIPGGWCHTRIGNVRDAGESESWPSGSDWQVDGWGPVDNPAGSPTSLSLGKSVTVGNTFHSTVGVDAKAVSAQVGFDVSWSSSVDTSYTITVPANQEWRISAGYVTHNYLYDVYQDCPGSSGGAAGTEQQIGTGVASQYDHLVYSAYQIA